MPSALGTTGGVPLPGTASRYASRCRRPGPRGSSAPDRRRRNSCRRSRGTPRRRRRPVPGDSAGRWRTARGWRRRVHSGTPPGIRHLQAAPFAGGHAGAAVADAEMKAAVGSESEAVEIVSEKTHPDPVPRTQAGPLVAHAVAIGVPEPPEVRNVGEPDVAAAREDSRREPLGQSGTRRQIRLSGSPSRRARGRRASPGRSGGPGKARFRRNTSATSARGPPPSGWPGRHQASPPPTGPGARVEGPS